MFEKVFEISSELLKGRVNEDVLKEKYAAAEAEFAEKIKNRNLELKELMEKSRPDENFYFLQQVDQIMVKSLAMLDEAKGNQESSNYIYPKLFENMRSIMSDFLNDINIAMNTVSTVLVEAMIESDKVNPIQPEEERPVLPEEDKDKINCNPPELPNILKDPYGNPDAKIIEVVFKYRELPTVEERIETAFKDAVNNTEEMLNKKIDEKLVATLKQAVTSYDLLKTYIEDGVASLSEVDTFGVEMTKECKIIMEMKQSQRLPEDIENLIQAFKWTLFAMPIPMQRHMEQMMQAAQQIELQKMTQSQSAVQGKASAPTGKHGGPGSLRANSNIRPVK